MEKAKLCYGVMQMFASYRIWAGEEWVHTRASRDLWWYKWKYSGCYTVGRDGNVCANLMFLFNHPRTLNKSPRKIWSMTYQCETLGLVGILISSHSAPVSFYISDVTIESCL